MTATTTATPDGDKPRSKYLLIRQGEAPGDWGAAQVTAMSYADLVRRRDGEKADEPHIVEG